MIAYNISIFNLFSLNDYSSEVRWSAALALGKIGDERAVDALNLAMRDRDGDVRREASEALEKIKQKKTGTPKP